MNCFYSKGKFFKSPCIELVEKWLQEFVKAVVAYQKKLNSTQKIPASLKLDKELEKKRNVIVRSFSLARNLYEGGDNIRQLKESDLKPGAEFFEV